MGLLVEIACEVLQRAIERRAKTQHAIIRSGVRASDPLRANRIGSAQIQEASFDVLPKLASLLTICATRSVEIGRRNKPQDEYRAVRGGPTRASTLLIATDRALTKSGAIEGVRAGRRPIFAH